MFSIQTLHSRRMLHVAGLLLWSFLSIILIVTWLRSLPENNRNTTLHVAIWLGVLTIYFFAEGLEMAYVDLRDKDAEQLTRSIRGILDLMNSEPGFLEAREWLLVVLVAVLTLISDFSHIDVPMVGYLEGEFWKVAFPLAFAAFPLVWFSQSLPKHLALRNAEAFLELSQNLPIWRLIRRIGIIAKWIGLFLPSDLLVDCACRKGLFSTKRNLPPSESAFFVSSLKRYGYALYRLYENVEIQADGRCRFQQKGVMYLQQGRRLRFTQFLRFESKIEQFEFPAVRLYAAPLIGEKLDEMAAQMNMVWKNKLLESFKLKEVSTKTFRKRFESDRNDSYKLWCLIESPCELPEELRFNPSSLAELKADSEKLEHRFEAADAVVLYWELDTKSEPNAFRVEFSQDDDPEWYFKDFSFPCAQYQLQITLAKEVSGTFARWESSATMREYGERHWRESQRLGKALVGEERELRLDLPHPLPGTRYTLRWRLW